MSYVRMFFDWRRRRRLAHQVRQLLSHARHVRRSWEDVARAEDLRALDTAAGKAGEALTGGQPAVLEAVGRTLEQATQRLIPARPYAALRENIEILVVAVVVAMAFRTYFIQPFKIPTSSMRPTLHGIHYLAKERPGVLDRLPFKVVKWVVFGEWYVEVRARQGGVAGVRTGPEGSQIGVAGVLYPAPDGMCLHVRHGDPVIAGQLLASGVRITGDHIFVNKMAWHFRSPRRDEIMVFRTDGINHADIRKNEHYVKRMVGVPHDTLSIQPPLLLVNGQPASGFPGIERNQRRLPEYAGYQNIGSYLLSQSNRVHLSSNQYFACGDNQLNSADSRYWGPVPRKNLVGPAFFVYWPVSRHWGWAR